MRAISFASGELRRGARRFDEPKPYDRRRSVSAYARMMRNWQGFEATSEGLRDHVIRYLGSADVRVYSVGRTDGLYSGKYRLKLLRRDNRGHARLRSIGRLDRILYRY
jgi:hypothetical protein